MTPEQRWWEWWFEGRPAWWPQRPGAEIQRARDFLRSPWARVARLAGRHKSRRWQRGHKELRELAQELHRSRP